MRHVFFVKVRGQYVGYVPIMSWPQFCFLRIRLLQMSAARSHSIRVVNSLLLVRRTKHPAQCGVFVIVQLSVPPALLSGMRVQPFPFTEIRPAYHIRIFLLSSFLLVFLFTWNCAFSNGHFNTFLHRTQTRFSTYLTSSGFNAEFAVGHAIYTDATSGIDESEWIFKPGPDERFVNYFVRSLI